MENNVLNTITARFTLHTTGTSLTPAEGFQYITVKGDPKSERPGASCTVPIIPCDVVVQWALENPEVAAMIAGIATQAQRDIIRNALANGAKPGSSLSVADVQSDAVFTFLKTSGAAALRLTKESLDRLIPAFRTATANRWAAVKGVSDTLSELEILNGSRATQERYILVLQSVKSEGIITPADAESLRRLLAMVIESGGEEAAIARLVLAKLAALEAKREALLGGDIEDL